MEDGVSVLPQPASVSFIISSLVPTVSVALVTVNHYLYRLCTSRRRAERTMSL